MPKAVDRNPQARGLGASLWNPLRSGVASYEDPYSAIDDTVEQAGGDIRGLIDGSIDGVVDTIFSLTGIDLSGPADLLEQLLDIPLAFLDSTPLGGVLNVLGQFFPFLPGASAGSFNPLSAANEFITGILNPTGLLALLNPFGFLSSSVIPSIDASKIVSGVLSVATLPATVVTTVTGVAANLIQGVLSALVIPALDASKIVSGVFAQSQVAALPSTLDAINAATIANSAAIEAIRAKDVAEGNSGIFVVDALEYSGPVSPTDYETTYLTGDATIGGYSVTGHQADAGQGASGAGLTWDVMYRRIKAADAHTKTVYQSLTIIAGSVIESLAPFGGTNPCLRIYVRLSDDRTKYVCAEIYSGYVKLRYRNGGAETDLGGQTNNVYHNASTAITVEPGTPGGVRVYRILFNGQVVHTVTDSGNVTDITQKGWAWGGRGTGYGTGQIQPTSVAQISIADNTPAPVYGSQFRAYRASGSNIDVGGRGPGNVAVPGNFFDTLDFKSDDFAWDPATQTLTCATTGIYTFVISYLSTTGWNQNQIQWSAVLLRNNGSGVYNVHRRGFSWKEPAAGWTRMYSALVNVPVTAGDQFRPGITLDTFVGSHNLAGNSDPTISEFSAARVA